MELAADAKNDQRTLVVLALPDISRSDLTRQEKKTRSLREKLDFHSCS
jgi:hypothetical protein